LDGSRRHESRKPHHYHLLTLAAGGRDDRRLLLHPNRIRGASAIGSENAIVRMLESHPERDASTGYLLGLAAITLALGATYRLMWERSDP
jgi:hypothetical protein